MSDTGAHFSAVTEDICDAIRAKISNLEIKLATFRSKFGWALMGPSLDEKMGTRSIDSETESLTEDIDKKFPPKLSHMSSNDGYSHGKMKKKFEKLKNEILKTSSFAQMRDILEQGHAKILQNLETRPSIFHICQNAPSLAVANFVLRHHAEKIKDLLPKSVNTVKKALKMEENGNIC